ncbi:ATP-dependent nuclease [Stenotrophomonas maltophilia]|uniref:ATP-dependent endonuclease n=1 Tax=Stenotrophomonas maltophilia TaxID=40324 RepID=A0A4S2CZ67_STEMA|nr:ATP-dependent endonuclease [Stenotrophomonas maltophilia]TGY33965.1 ATP-dependent endonuclease [Stenotrophomonas maltophilia]
MRISTLRIENYRAFEDETIDFGQFTCLVGMNGAGKSTVLNALNTLFQEKGGATDPARLAEEDFHKRNVDRRIAITATFVDLPPEAVEELKDYVREEQLVVSAVALWDGSGADVQQVGSRLGVIRFAPCFKAASARECKAEYEGLLGEDFDLPKWKSQTAAIEVLREFERQNSDQCQLIESQDTFYGIAGSSRLKKYVQWVYVPAVKDARDEQAETKDGALGRLLARTVRLSANFQAPLDELRGRVQGELDEIFRESQKQLDAVAEALTARLTEWSHEDASVSLGWEPTNPTFRPPNARALVAEGEFQGSIARFGHGFQRAYLLTLLQELAGKPSSGAPTLILGCEEPELYQHPPQARHMAEVLRNLSESGSQVIATTHSPLFVSAEYFESVRVMRRLNRSSPARVSAYTFSAYAERYFEVLAHRPMKNSAAESTLGELLRPELNELFFARKLVLVEGTEDRAYLLTWAHQTGFAVEMRRRGIDIVAAGGKSNSIRLALIAQGLEIPTHIVFDSDSNDDRHRNEHERDNLALLRLAGDAERIAFPEWARWGPLFSQWPCELRDLVLAELEESLGHESLEKMKESARTACGMWPRLEKNSRYIQELITLSVAAGAKSATLTQLCGQIVSDAW